jgi:hypothetical protein
MFSVFVDQSQFTIPKLKQGAVSQRTAPVRCETC